MNGATRVTARRDKRVLEAQRAASSRQPTVAQLRAYAVARTLFAPVGLAEAVAALRFVQLDPIRAPARAQDLILRHRVIDYHNGDLQRRYAELGLAEDHLHVYGVMPSDVQRFLHPRRRVRRWRVETEHPRLAAKILAHVAKHGATHPRDLQAALGRQSIVNGWGGQSSATTRMLEALHYRGLLRVSHRAQGIRVYAAAPAPVAGEASTRRERVRQILQLLLHLYAPLPERTLRELARMSFGHSLTESQRNATVDDFAASSEIVRSMVDGVAYLWPADENLDAGSAAAVRLLAPFDPIVWDRRRFEHLWGWPYRFEAYTPVARRVFGYYALPLLWGDTVIGWANVAVSNDALNIGLGFVNKRPRAAAFRRELDAELARIAAFLGVSHRPTIEG
jgi:uncharacterized protein